MKLEELRIERGIKKLGIFATYDGEDMTENEELYVGELRKRYECVIVAANEERKVKERGDIGEGIIFVTMENMTLDFGMYGRVLRQIEEKDGWVYEGIEEVGLFNDSCIIIKPLDGVFEKIDEEKTAGACGLTLSMEVSRHAQSFFVVYRGKRVIDILRRFFKENDVFAHANKGRNEIIRIYEVGICGYMEGMGIKTEGIYKMVNGNGEVTNMNPTYIGWRVILGQGAPLVKKRRMKWKDDYGNIMMKTASEFRKSVEKAMGKA